MLWIVAGCGSLAKTSPDDAPGETTSVASSRSAITASTTSARCTLHVRIKAKLDAGRNESRVYRRRGSAHMQLLTYTAENNMSVADDERRVEGREKASGG